MSPKGAITKPPSLILDFIHSGIASICPVKITRLNSPGKATGAISKSSTDLISIVGQ